MLKLASAALDVDVVFGFVRGRGSVSRRGDLRGVLKFAFDLPGGAVLGSELELVFDLLDACGLGVELELAFGGLDGDPGLCRGVSAI